MDKPLTDNGKKPDASGQDTPVKDKTAAGEALSAVSKDTVQDSAKDNQHIDIKDKQIGAYSQGATRPLITRKAWDEKNDHDTWMDDPKRRLAIRLFSRGVLGAAFFTAGGMLARKWMHGYDATKSFGEQANQNPLTFIAKVIDTGIGKPIESTVTAIAGKEAGLASVRFRPTHYGRVFGKEMRGRSLGDEVVNITFDFFCASVGDAWGRDIAGWFDPNVKKTWMDDKGNIKIPKAIDAALNSMTRYITYNGGEDWAVSIPYAYFMKGQRSLLNRMSPGFKYDFDRGLNGGSFKVRNGVIAGNYNVEGMIDLQNRFTVYNIGTLMYREAYDYLRRRFDGKATNLYGAPDKKPEDSSILGSIGAVAKWVARSAIKGVIIMTPAVPFFWITRTPQSKHKGAFIDADKGILATTYDHDTFTANELQRSPSTEIEYLKYENKGWPGKSNYDRFSQTPAGTIADFEPRLAERHPGYISRNAFDAYGTTFGAVDAGFNAIGRANYKAAGALDKPADWLDKRMGATGNRIKEAIGVRDNKFKNFTRPMVYAAASYTPYMYAKSEFSNLWDHGKMDMAAERLVDGVAKLNWGEFKAGLGEVWNTILFKPLTDPAREKEGQRRMEMDTSPPDIFSETQTKSGQDFWENIMEKRKRQERERKEAVQKKEVAQKDTQNPDISWQERVVSGPQKMKAEARPVTDKPKTRAEQEAMRKALEELNPPTNSIN